MYGVGLVNITWSAWRLNFNLYQTLYLHNYTIYCLVSPQWGAIMIVDVVFLGSKGTVMKQSFTLPFEEEG